MAAKNLFRVSDLIAKYGWKVMPYLSNLGPTLLAEAQVLFVDSGHTNASDADDTEHGHSFEKPLATWDYAVGLLTADEGGIILMAPGHSENIATGVTIDADVNGIACIGLGSGTLRPRFDFDAADSTIDVGGNNVTFANLTFRPGFADVLIGVDVETGKTNFRMLDCEFLEGEAAGDEFLADVELKAGCHDAVIKNNVFRAGWSSNPDDGVSLKGASNRVTIKDNKFSGPYGDGIGVTAAISNSSGVCLDLLIENNIMKVKDGESGIEVIATTPAIIRHNLIVSTGLAVDSMIVATIGELDQNIGVTTDGTSGESILGGTISPEIVQYNLDHLAKTDTGIAGDADLTTMVADGSLLAHIMSATANTSTYEASTDSLEAISVVVNAIASPTDVTAAVPAAPVAKSVQDMLNKDRAGSNTYDSSTDSLEALRDHLDGTTILGGINLDHLCLTTTGVAIDGELDQHITALSILGHIMATDADPSSYNCSTDSLQSIATAVAAISFTAAVSATPTARSLQDILEKDGTSSFDDTTDSLEAIADRLIDSKIDLLTSAADGTGNYPASVVQDSVVAMILSKSANPVASSFDNQTDSLEAIRDNQQAAARAAIDDSELDHLCELDGATQAYPENAVNDSIIAKILCKGDPATINTYDCQTDSLEAISDLLRTGTTVLAGLQLDHLCGTSTGVGADADLETYCVAGSLMSHVLSVSADATTYKPSTDSLEAIGTDTDTIIANIATAQTELNKIGTVTNAGGTATIGAILGDFANSDLVTRLGNLQTDADRWGTLVNAGGTAELGSMLGDFANSDLVTRLGVITTDTAAIDPGAKRLITATTTDWALSATNNMFTVGGLVRAKIWGEVLVGVKAVAMNLKVIATPTAPGGAVDVTANLDCNADAAGTVYKMATTLGGAMVEVTAGVSLDNGIDVILPPGVVELGSGANEDGGGSIQWFCQYEPLEAGATVTAT